MPADEAAGWKPKAIIFDLLTGLLDSWSAWNEAAGAEERGLRWRMQYLEVTYGTGEYEPYEELVEEAARLANVSLDCPKALLAGFPDSLHPWPGVPETLGKLRQLGYKLGVITNCSKTLGRKAAARCGIDFDMVITAEESGFYKPRLEAYQAGLDAMGLKAEDVLFVAGSPGDVLGARDAGMQVVWHNQAQRPAKEGAKPLREGRTLQEALQDFK